MTRSRIAKAGWIVGVMAALGLAGYAATSSPKAEGSDAAEAADRAPQPVRVTQVLFSSAAQAESYTGTIRPQHEAPLGFRLPGKMIARLVDVGDRVTAGQILARLDDLDARLELEAAKAEVDAARTDLARAEAEAKRSRDLHAEGHVAQAILDRAISTAAEARSRADRAEQMRSLAANRLSYAQLFAEADGIVTAALAEPGEVVAAGQPVLSVAREEAVDVVFAVPEQQRDVLKTAVAQAEIWGAAEKPYALRLRDISPDVDPVGRTYRVRMTFVAPDADVTFGRTVTLRLQTFAGPPAAALPLAAVVNDGSGAAVWRLSQEERRVERVAVDLVTIAGKVALVRGPLAEGDRVISLGAHKIDPSRPVRVVETAPAPES